MVCYAKKCQNWIVLLLKAAIFRTIALANIDGGCYQEANASDFHLLVLANIGGCCYQKAHESDFLLLALANIGGGCY